MDGGLAIVVPGRLDDDVSVARKPIQPGDEQSAGEDPADRLVAAVVEQSRNGQRVGRVIVQRGRERKDVAVGAEQAYGESLGHRGTVAGHMDKSLTLVRCRWARRPPTVAHGLPCWGWAEVVGPLAPLR